MRKLADTTWAHQVANAILLQAPLLVYAAHPANILANPAADIIKSIPSVWDETVVLSVSAIGEVAAFARRAGNTAAAGHHRALGQATILGLANSLADDQYLRDLFLSAPSVRGSVDPG